MTGFVKLQSSILQSTVWREENHVRILWITMLAMSDKDGIVEGSIPGLADAARITLQECEDGLNKLMSPDPYSRTKDFGGRRVDEIDGGWVLLNYIKYRAPTSTQRVREYRERKKEENNGLLQPGCANETFHGVSQCSNELHAFPSVSVSVSENSFLVNESQEGELSSGKKVTKSKSQSKLKKESSVSKSLKDRTVKYMRIFNEVFGRRTRVGRKIEKRIDELVSEDVDEWMILAMPIVQSAIDHSVNRLNNFDALMLLRTGEHKKTSRDGTTTGATDWIQRAYGNADKHYADARLSAIAYKYGLADIVGWLMKGMVKDENNTVPQIAIPGMKSSESKQVQLEVVNED